MRAAGSGFIALLSQPLGRICRAQPHQQWPELRFLLRYLAVALALFWLGSSFFRRHKPTFPDLL